MSEEKAPTTVLQSPLYVKKPAEQRVGYKVSQWTKKRVQFEAHTLDTPLGAQHGVLLTVHRNRPRKVSERQTSVSTSSAQASTSPIATSPSGFSPEAVGQLPQSPDQSGQHLSRQFNSRYSLHSFLSPSNTLLYRCKCVCLRGPHIWHTGSTAKI